MDLVKKNIHMDHTKADTVTQLTFDEDMNLPENKPDCDEICFSRGWVETTDIKPFMDEVRIVGNLCYSLLYHTEERGCSLVRLEGKLPFEEKVLNSFVGSRVCLQRRLLSGANRSFGL